MPTGKTRERAQNLWKLLKPKSPGSGPTSIPQPASGNSPANSLDTTILSNVISGPSPIPKPASSKTPPNTLDTMLRNTVPGSSASTSKGITRLSTLAGPAYTTGDQSQDPQLPTLVPVKNEAFQNAVQEYVDHLSDGDKNAFQSATDIMERLGELQQDKPRTSTSHMQKVQKVLQCVKQFLVSTAICIQHSPEISSLVVGGLNCVLTLALGYIEFFENLTDMMERIGDHLTYLSVYATGGIATSSIDPGNVVFQNSENVQKALVMAYCDLLDFYVKVRNLFTNKEGKSSYAQGLKRFLKVSWEPFEVQFQSIENRFIHHTNIIVRLAGAEHQINSYKKEAQDRQRQDDNEGRRKILEWLSPDDFEGTHEKHSRKRFQGTGQWLLNDPRFVSWRDGAQSSLLWCYGSPGSGKTILTSLVIDHLSACHELSTNIGITFIYCNYTESRSSFEYIRLAIKQLCRGMKSLSPQLSKVYEQHYKNHSQPRFRDLQDLFLAIAQQFHTVFFVLDALDECSLDQRTDLFEFFARVVELGTGAGFVKLFVTSRKELDIERAFLRQTFPKIDVEATKVDSDIGLYAKAQIEQRLHDGSLVLNNIMLKDKILTALTMNASGMFLWVELQLNAICAQVSDYGIEETLQNIPQDIDATYERILNIINNKPPAQRELARKALLFIAYAKEPVSIDTLALAIAVRDHTQSLDMLRSSISTEKIILDACGNLLSADGTYSSIRRVCFIHFSAHEFFTSHRSKLHILSFQSEVANREIAQMCMIFLLILYSQIQDYCTDIESAFANDYILPALPQHLLAGNLNSVPQNDKMINLMLLFFERGPPMLGPHNGPHFVDRTFFTFSPSVLALIFHLPGQYQSYRRYTSESQDGKQLDHKALSWVHGRAKGSSIIFARVYDDRLAMHYAIGQLDSADVGRRLSEYEYPVNYSYDSSDGPLNASNSWGKQQWVPSVCRLTPIYLVKSEEVTRFLLDKGAYVNPHLTKPGLPNLLGYLAEGGNTKVVLLLLGGGAEQNEEARIRALHIAAQDGQVETIRLLLDIGVDVNAGNALQAAARNGKVEAMRLLLEKGANVNAKDALYGSALQAAANSNVEALRLLLDNGADVNAHGRHCGNALQTAAYHGNIQAIQLLLDRGADVNAQGGWYNNALNAAAYHGNIGAMRLLLEKGADVHMQGGRYGNALQAVACNGNIEVMRLLLDKGADVNAQGGYFGNALQAAAYHSNIDAMQFLLDERADVNAQSGHYGNALQATAFNGNVQAIQLLLDKGADINAQGRCYSNALQVAAGQGRVEAMKLLLENGVDIHAQGGEHGNALQAAAYYGNIEAVRLLLDKGADVNAQGGHFGNALQAAAYHGGLGIMQILLDKGADVNARSGYFGNALQAAAYHGSVGAIQLLLAKGADANAQGGMFRTALQAATHRGNVDAMRLLPDNVARTHARGGWLGNTFSYGLGYNGEDYNAMRTSDNTARRVYKMQSLHRSRRGW